MSQSEIVRDVLKKYICIHIYLSNDYFNFPLLLLLLENRNNNHKLGKHVLRLKYHQFFIIIVDYI